MPRLIKKNTKPLRFCTGLSSYEFACKCHYSSCRSIAISNKLIKAYKNFRKALGVKLIVNSGFRCTQHNYDEGGKALSRHLTGEAIDISLKTIDHLTHDEIENFAEACGFTFVLFYKTFVHLDCR